MDRTTPETKVAKGYTLTTAEQAFMMKSCDNDGSVSRRRFTGLADYPTSEIDVRETTTDYGSLTDYSG